MRGQASEKIGGLGLLLEGLCARNLYVNLSAGALATTFGRACYKRKEILIYTRGALATTLNSSDTKKGHSSDVINENSGNASEANSNGNSSETSEGNSGETSQGNSGDTRETAVMHFKKKGGRENLSQRG